MTNNNNISACAKVLGTTELHEQILLNLPLRDLLLAKRVSRAWRNTMAGSPQIQEALFFRPNASSVVAIQPSSEDSTETYQDVEMFKDNWILISPSNNDAKDRSCQPIVNPFFPFDGDYNPNTDPARIYFPGRLLTNEPEIEGFHHRNASWKRMQFLQPPAAHVSLLCLGGHVEAQEQEEHADEGEEVELLKCDAVEVVDTNGVTIGAMFTAMIQHMQGCELCQKYEWGLDVWLWPFRGSAQLARVSDELNTGFEMLQEINKVEDKAKVVKNEGKQGEGND